MPPWARSLPDFVADPSRDGIGHEVPMSRTHAGLFYPIGECQGLLNMTPAELPVGSLGDALHF